MTFFDIEASQVENFERWKKEHDEKVRADEREKFAEFALSAFALLFTKEELLEQFEGWCNYQNNKEQK